MKAEKILMVGKDLILFLGGLAGIGYQTRTGDVNPLLLLTFSLMAGVPGLMYLVAIIRGPAIESQSSSSPSQQQSSE